MFGGLIEAGLRRTIEVSKTLQWRGPYTMESRVGANNYRVKMGFKTKTYHVNMSKKYIAREPEVDVVHTSNKDDATTAVARVIYQDTDQELGKYETWRAIMRKKGSMTSN